MFERLLFEYPRDARINEPGMDSDRQCCTNDHYGVGWGDGGNPVQHNPRDGDGDNGCHHINDRPGHWVGTGDRDWVWGIVCYGWDDYQCWWVHDPYVHGGWDI
jgi:hypothetical protein